MFTMLQRIWASTSSSVPTPISVVCFSRELACKMEGCFLEQFAILQVFLWGKNLEIYWMEKAPQAQFAGRQKLNYFLVRFPSQWQKIVKGMVTVTMETPTLFFARGKGTSTGYLYLARLQTLFSIITSAWFTCVGRPVSLREHSHPSTCV